MSDSYKVILSKPENVKKFKRDMKLWGYDTACRNLGISWYAPRDKVDKMVVEGVEDENNSMSLLGDARCLISGDNKTWADNLLDAFIRKVQDLQAQIERRDQRLEYLQKQLDIYKREDEKDLTEKLGELFEACQG